MKKIHQVAFKYLVSIFIGISLSPILYLLSANILNQTWSLWVTSIYFLLVPIFFMYKFYPLFIDIRDNQANEQYQGLINSLKKPINEYKIYSNSHPDYWYPVNSEDILDFIKARLATRDGNLAEYIIDTNEDAREIFLIYKRLGDRYKDDKRMTQNEFLEYNQKISDNIEKFKQEQKNKKWYEF